MAFDINSLLEKPIEQLEDISVAFKCPPKATLRTVIDTLRAAKIGCLIVAEGNQVQGIITERDILMKITGKTIDYDKETVQIYMTPSPITVSKKSSIGEAMRLMLSHNFRHLVIADEHSSVVQIISIKDLLKYIVSSLDQSILDSPSELWKKGA